MEQIKTAPDAERNVNCSGNVCAGDTVRFAEAVFTGSFRKPTFAGVRTTVAEVVKCSYGQTGMHTFTIKVVESEGVDALPAGKTCRKQARTIYKYGCFRARWENESDREAALQGKYDRAAQTRRAKQARRELVL